MHLLTFPVPRFGTTPDPIRTLPSFKRGQRSYVGIVYAVFPLDASTLWITETIEATEGQEGQHGVARAALLLCRGGAALCPTVIILSGSVEAQAQATLGWLCLLCSHVGCTPASCVWLH